MQRIIVFLKSSYLLWLTIFCLFIGIYFFSELSFLGNYVNWFLAVIFFLSAFTIDLQAIKHESKKIIQISWFLILSLTILPLLIYYLVSSLDKQNLIALVLLSAMPPGLTSPTVAGIIGGKKSLALVLTIASSFLAPVIVPIVLSLTIKEKISFDFWQMSGQIALLTILPFLAGTLLKRITPKISRFLKPSVQNISVFFLGLIIISIISKTTSEYGTGIFIDFANLIILGKLAIFFLLLHFLGWFLFFKQDKPHRISFMVSFAYMNFTLALTLAQKFFPNPEVIIPLVLAIIPWTIAISVAKYKLKKIL